MYMTIVAGEELRTDAKLEDQLLARLDAGWRPTLEGLVLGMSEFGLSYTDMLGDLQAMRPNNDPHRLEEQFGSAIVGLVNNDKLDFNDEGRSFPRGISLN